MEFGFIILISIAVAALLKAFIGVIIPSKYKTNLPPGPFNVPLISNLQWLLKSFTEIEPILRNLHSKLGPVVTLYVGPRPAISIADRSLAHKALVQNGAIFADRPPPLPTWKIISSNQHDISSASYGTTWRVFRRNLSTEILHPLRVKSYRHARKWVLEILLNRLKSESKNGDRPVPVRLLDHFLYAMFCLLVLMCFGDKLDESQIKRIENVQRRLLLAVGKFNVLNFWPRLTKIVFAKKWIQFLQVRRDQENVLVPLIRARKKMKEEESLGVNKEEYVLSYVDTLLDLQLHEEKRKLSEEEIVSLCSEFLSAGTGSTSTVLQWIMANLVKYQHVQEKVHTEIRGVVGENEEVKEEELQEMPYLKAVILEGLRRHPPGHFLFPHAVTEDFVLDDKYVIPKDGSVNFMVADMGWDPKVWEDPMAFKPERFLNDHDQDFDITGSREIKMMPFGAGRRICPGFGLAMLHLEYFVANLVWNFEWKAVDGDEVVDKEKKKKNRRSNRRSNKNSSVNEIRGEATQTKNGYKTKNLTSSMNCSSTKQQDLDLHPLSEQDPTGASTVTFSSMPTMHINEEESAESGSTQSQLLLATDLCGSIISRSCPEPIANDSSCWAYTNKDDNPSHQSEGRCKIFAPHWSMEAVNEALEKGDAFKALYRVNAHNRLEAYCKIEGVQTDVLITGIAAQNRAVEGDFVLIKVDRLSLWAKMKGFSNNSSIVEDSNLPTEANGMHSDICKGKSKVDVSYEYSNCTLLSEKGIHHDDDSSSEAYNQEMIEREGYNYINGHHPSTSDSTEKVSSSQQNDGMNAIERLSAMISSYPTKRPTGRVVSIIERSPRRDGIVGFLNVNQWFNYKGGSRKDAKKNRSSLSVPDREYIQLTPTHPKYPKMVVLVKDLPDSIKKRLEEGDATIEMELVAARIDEWNEESPFPQAHVLHVFGRGGEVEPQINAILYENAICCSGFSPESLSCLPCVPWEMPQEELLSRKDLRNFCIFTIDPSTATDLDDALSIERLSDGISRVGVHIADVSYFVLPGTALDIEAQVRSTSVYMLQRKIPMLPVLLSEEVGSLNPGVDRLAFSIFWDLNSAGDVVDRWIGRTVIRSCCKLSYEHAQDIIDGKFDVESSNTLGEGWPQLYGQFEWSDVVRSIKSLYEVSKILKDKRFTDGALRLENSKPVFLFDEYGTPYDSVLSGREDLNFLFEEFMLLANKTAAEVIARAFPDSALLRRHPAPNMRKLREFEAFCSKHGLQLDTSSSGQFHQSLEQAREKLKDDYVLFDILINYATRPMQLASYFCSGDFKDDTDWGHYALAFPVYTHFTSPLRRYPDLVVHRTLNAALEAEKLYWKHRRTLPKNNHREGVRGRFLTGIFYNKDAAESLEGREALSVAALKYGVPCADILVNVATHCNDRKLACRNVKDACVKLYMWILLKKKEVLLSEARVLALGPRFMTVYIEKLAIERRIYYDEVEGLIVEWLDTTSTLVLSLCAQKRSFKRGSPGNYKALEEVALVVRPNDLKEEHGMFGGSVNKCFTTDANAKRQCSGSSSNSGVDPGVFPLTIPLLSTIPVALNAIGGGDGPLEIGVRLYMSSYMR